MALSCGESKTQATVSQGLEYEFDIVTRDKEHLIRTAIPATWLHMRDELYERMRGVFENAPILVAAYFDVEKKVPLADSSLKSLGQQVPNLMIINYRKGLVFQTVSGQFTYSLECLGFITTLQRGTEWVTTRTVTQELSEDFPT